MILKNVHRNKLHKELWDAGINCHVTSINNDFSEIGADIKFDDDTDMILAQSIIDAHDPFLLPTVSNDEILNAKIEVQTINTLIDLGVI